MRVEFTAERHAKSGRRPRPPCHFLIEIAIIEILIYNPSHLIASANRRGALHAMARMPHGRTRLLASMHDTKRPSEPSIAVLLAGQARTLLEPNVRRELLDSVNGSALFAHLSTEHSYAHWHNFSVPSASGASSSELGASLRREFHRPLHHLRIVPDEELIRTSSLWIGSVAGRFSALFLRWLVLHGALEDVERTRRSRFEFVLRLRPDLLLLCLVPSDVTAWMGGYDAVQQGDWALLLKRHAADVALRAYLYANASATCSHRVETCVPSFLSMRNYSVGSISGFAWVVRPESFCAAFVGKLTDSLVCGRGVIGRRSKLPCTSIPHALKT